MSSRFILPLADVGSGIKPSDGAKLFFSINGLPFSSDPKDTFTDNTDATPNANPVIADSKGVFPDIYIVGSNRAVLKDKNDVQIWQIDDIDEAAIVSDTASSKSFVTLIGGPAETSAVENTGLVAGDVVNVKERTSGNGGESTWDVVLSTTVTENTFNIVQGTGVATLSLVLRLQTFVDMKKFGAVGDGTTDDTLAFNTATLYLKTSGGVIFAPDSTYIISDDASYLEANNTGIRMYSNITLAGQSRHKTILKMADSAVNATHVVHVDGGASVPWNTGRISNVNVRNLTIDGNRDNHDRVSLTDGVTTASSTTVTSAAALFTSAMVGFHINIDRNRGSFTITDVTASGSEAIVEVLGHDIRAGELIFISGITATGDFATMNNNSFTVVSVTKLFNERLQSVTVSKTLSSGSYTSGGTLVGGSLTTTIATFVSPTEITVTSAPILTTTQNKIQIEQGENGWGVSILGADDVVIENVTVKNCWGDGIYIDKEFGGTVLSPSTQINILNVDSDGNRRQGLSAVDVEFLNIDNSTFRNTGIDGVGPGAGIDLEPDAGIVRYVNITNSFMLDNVGEGFACSKIFTDTSGTPLVLGAADIYGTWDVFVSNCAMLRNRRYGVTAIACNEGLTIDNCTIKFNRAGGIRLRGLPTGKVTQQQKITNNIISWNQWFIGTVGSSNTDDPRNGHGIVMADNANKINMNNILISMNSIEYNDGHGVYCSGETADNLYITDNSIIGSGQELDNTYANIKVEGTKAEGLDISRNFVHKGYNSATTHPYGIASPFVFSAYGILVTTATTYDSVIARNNVRDGGNTADISITNMLNETAGTNNYAYSNFGFKTDSTVQSSAQNSATTGTSTVTINHTLDITPLSKHITLTISDDIGGTPMSTIPAFDTPPYISAISSTQITVKWAIGTGGVGNFLITARTLGSIID